MDCPCMVRLNQILIFLDRCHKRRYISIPMNIKELLYRQDRRLFWTTPT